MPRLLPVIAAMFAGAHAASAQIYDTCLTAFGVPSLPFSQVFDNSANTGTPSVNPCVSFTHPLDESSQWVQLTAPVTGSYTFAWSDNDFDIEVAVFSGSCLSLDPIDCAGEPTPIEIVRSFDAGQVIYVQTARAPSAPSGGQYTLFIDVDPYTPPECEPGTVFAQPPLPPMNPLVNAAFSDAELGSTAIDNLQLGSSQVVAGLTVWGFQYSGFVPCSESPTLFEVIFYEDDGGQPGAPICARPVEVAPAFVPGGNVYFGNSQLLRFDLLVPGTCTLPPDVWVSVRDVFAGTSPCSFAWVYGEGDGSFFVRDQSGLVMQFEGDVSFCVVPADPCPTDSNRDGTTDLADLLTVLANFGVVFVATLTDGDTNYDGAVLLDDLLAVLAEFGNPCP